MSSGDKNESKHLTGRRRKTVPRGRRRRKRLKPRPRRLPKPVDSRTTGQSRNAGWSTGRNSSSRRGMIGKVTMKRLALIRTKIPLRLTRMTSHPRRSLPQMWPRLSCTRMIDPDPMDQLPRDCGLLSSFRSYLTVAFGSTGGASMDRTKFHRERSPFSCEISVFALRFVQ